MQNILLTIHILIALSLVTVIMLQRSEAGTPGVGGIGGGGLAGTRGKASFLTRLTGGLAVAFFATTVLLALLSGTNQGGGIVLPDSVILLPPGPGESLPLPGGGLPGGDLVAPPAPE